MTCSEVPRTAAISGIGTALPYPSGNPNFRAVLATAIFEKEQMGHVATRSNENDAFPALLEAGPQEERA
jgi:hypothetical protein